MSPNGPTQPHGRRAQVDNSNLHRDFQSDYDLNDGEAFWSESAAPRAACMRASASRLGLPTEVGCRSRVAAVSRVPVASHSGCDDEQYIEKSSDDEHSWSYP